MRILIKNATLIDPSHPSHGEILSFLVDEGVISDIGTKITKADRIIEAENLHFSPGWFDPLVSFGEPGYEERESLKNGLFTAASSGFTHIGLLPNVFPVADSQSGIVHQISKSRGAVTSLHPLGSLTEGSLGKNIAELFNMQQVGAIAFYDAYHSLDKFQLVKIALE